MKTCYWNFENIQVSEENYVFTANNNLAKVVIEGSETVRVKTAIIKIDYNILLASILMVKHKHPKIQVHFKVGPTTKLKQFTNQLPYENITKYILLL